ncbi:4-hydroxy-tetrahydrodipicolinate reductase [Pelagibacterium xiamenense]|uniref:4-hydroxy-tetrahydrodipicolinate reductase n=1 Tax=Pelagibacterium xiamenense TaxID=2901140 RepID=UPI001E3584CF|nr:4-hydroxy-tetrahydrodipicolinate reductase [Pelagibacterium xiamenense]MCD7058455.1 4-hydroxy-tetrahydrodipicolinate reductase [Pelagibacterium xiamenense]
MTLKIGIVGAGGRMGQANIKAVAAHEGLTLVAAIDRAGAPALGKDAGALAGLEPLGVTIGDDLPALLDAVDAVLDFTAPALTVEVARRVAQKGLIHIIGTTGCSPGDDAAIAAAAEAGARIVKSGNMSLGVNLLAALVKKAAAALDETFDIEVLEMHHRHKVDAPSGTALLLGEAAAEGRDIDLNQHSVRVRDGHTGPREAGSIGFATLRGGGIVGEHSVLFSSMAETITLSHSARDRALFADGAIRAALWAADKPGGLYSMADVLGLSD